METTKLEEKAYALIKAQIMNGIFYPGVRLVERDLASQLKMSRTPVRWALHQLEHEGFLDRTDKRGVCIKLPTREEALDMLDVRAAIESMAAYRAATRRSEQQATELEDVVAAMRETITHHDVLTYYRLTGVLHKTIFEAACNRELVAFATRLNAQSTRFHFRTLLVPSRLATSLAEHQEVVKHIHAQNAEQAGLCMRNHILTVKELIATHDDLAPGALQIP